MRTFLRKEAAFRTTPQLDKEAIAGKDPQQLIDSKPEDLEKEGEFDGRVDPDRWG